MLLRGNFCFVATKALRNKLHCLNDVELATRDVFVGEQRQQLVAVGDGRKELHMTSLINIHTHDRWSLGRDRKERNKSMGHEIKYEKSKVEIVEILKTIERLKLITSRKIVSQMALLGNESTQKRKESLLILVQFKNFVAAGEKRKRKVYENGNGER